MNVKGRDQRKGLKRIWMFQFPFVSLSVQPQSSPSFPILCTLLYSSLTLLSIIFTISYLCYRQSTDISFFFLHGFRMENDGRPFLLNCHLSHLLLSSPFSITTLFNPSQLPHRYSPLATLFPWSPQLPNLCSPIFMFFPKVSFSPFIPFHSFSVPHPLFSPFLMFPISQAFIPFSTLTT